MAHCVLFDLDGTLANTIDAIITSYQHTFRVGLGVEYEPEWIRARIGIPLDDQIASVAGADRLEELRAIYLAHNLAALPRLVRAYDGMKEIVDDVRAQGALVGIVTSKRRHSAEKTLEACQLDLPLLVASEDTELHKPHAEPLLEACRRLNVEPSADFAYVGDTAWDVGAAKAAGFRSLAVTWGAGARQTLHDAAPDVLCDDVAQLRTALAL